MYKLGQSSGGLTSGQQQEFRRFQWLLWTLPVVGAVAGDYIAAGKLRPFLVLPHTRWRTERRGRVGASIGGIIGFGAAFMYLKQRKDAGALE